MNNVLRGRQIHLDFHTSADIPDVGRDFDAAAFAATLSEANVDSVTLFAKCHHGHLYYDTKRPERHPSLPAGLDLLGEQIEACRRLNIRTPIYISVQCDEYAANLHRDWRAINPDGTTVGRKPLEAPFYTWQILDMSSPYADYLAEQIEEVVRRYTPVDGIFLDMCWDQPSVGRWAINGMRSAGLEPSSESDRAAYARQVTHGYMRRYNDLIEKVNGGKPARVFYNSRPKTRLVDEARFYKHLELEALPTGGWGYTYFPLNVRLARTVGLPWIGMTGRFFKGWSDFGGIKPRAALLYECAQMLAHGGGCSVGDQLHPRGVPDAAAYQLIGDVYAHVKACEPWCNGATAVTEIGVFRDLDNDKVIQPGDPLEGVVRLLQQTFQQFDFVHDVADLSGYRLLVLPDGCTLSPTRAAALEAHIDRGGKVILCGAAAVAAASPKLRAAIGIGETATPDFNTVFLRYDPAVIPGALPSDLVLYEPSAKLSPAIGATGVGRIVEPYFDRSYAHYSGHCQTPPASATDAFAATFGPAGAAFGFDLFGQFARHGSGHLKTVARAALGHVLPEPLVRSDAPSHVELSITRLPDGRHVIHVVSFAPQRRTPDLDLVEEPTGLHEIEICLRRPDTTNVTDALEGSTFEMTLDGPYVCVRLSTQTGHAMVVFA